jgi:uncharacterized alkaline shock family protein YloU
VSDDIEEKEEVVSIDVVAIAKYINDSILEMDEVTSFAPSKGVRVYEHDAGVIIDLYINARFGVRIPELAWEIQRQVKHGVEGEFSINIESVNVHIQGVE